MVQAVARFWREGRSPTSAELMEQLHLATLSGLDDLLRPVEGKGFLQVERPGQGKQRRFHLTPRGRAQTGFGLPILGEIPGGAIAEAIQECEEWIDGMETALRARPGDFGLRVRGDSMLGDCIVSGDRVLLRPDIDWYPGQIVAAQIRDEERGIYYGTLKHCDLLDGGKTVRLRASNPAYEPMLFDARVVSIAAVYKGLIRRFD